MLSWAVLVVSVRVSVSSHGPTSVGAPGGGRTSAGRHARSRRDIAHTPRRSRLVWARGCPAPRCVVCACGVGVGVVEVEVRQESDSKELTVLAFNQLGVRHTTSDGQSVELSIGFVVVAHEIE